VTRARRGCRWTRQNALAGDDAVAQPAVDAVVPATVERAWRKVRGEVPE